MIQNVNIDGKSFNTRSYSGYITGVWKPKLGTLSGKWDVIYLPPGSHSIKYEKHVLSDERVAFLLYVEREGYTRSPGEEEEYWKVKEDGSYSYIRPATDIWGNINEYEWKEESKEFLGEAGKTYCIQNNYFSAGEYYSDVSELIGSEWRLDWRSYSTQRWAWLVRTDKLRFDNCGRLFDVNKKEYVGTWDWGDNNGVILRLKKPGGSYYFKHTKDAKAWDIRNYSNLYNHITLVSTNDELVLHRE